MFKNRFIIKFIIGVIIIVCISVIGTTNTNIKVCEHSYYLCYSKNATCTTSGYSLYKCSKCGKIYNIICESVRHDFIKSVKYASCTKDGYSDKVCRRCGYTKHTVFKAFGHDYEYFDTVNGKDIYRCVRCWKIRK